MVGKDDWKYTRRRRLNGNWGGLKILENQALGGC